MKYTERKIKTMEYEEYYLEQQPNKPVFPSGDTNEDGFLGINFREALIISLAGNPGFVVRNHEGLSFATGGLINAADRIVKLLVEERKKK